MNQIDGYEFEQRSLTPTGSWHPFTGWHECYIYRIKPKPKVKKWRFWNIQSDGYYTEEEAQKFGFGPKVISTMIEVDEE